MTERDRRPGNVRDTCAQIDRLSRVSRLRREWVEAFFRVRFALPIIDSIPADGGVYGPAKWGYYGDAPRDTGELRTNWPR